MSSRGIARERAVRKLLGDAGWWTARAAGSLGDADVIAIADHRILLVEVKSTTASPFTSFSPLDRREILAAAKICGAEAWLCWWPLRTDPYWIPSALWPSPGVRIHVADLVGSHVTPTSNRPMEEVRIVRQARVRDAAQTTIPVLHGQLELPL